MLKKLILVLIPVLIISFVVNTSYGDKKSKTFSGILVDTKCYAMNNENVTNDHGKMKGCAAMCAKMGIPVGLLIDGKKNGKVYVLAVPAPKLADHMGKWARVTGVEKFKRGLVLEKIEVKKGEIYEEVKIQTMM
ncbi:MAG: hypothetical protein ACE5KZ_00435 [Candidatus Scalinduaceae bacterium]